MATDNFPNTAWPTDTDAVQNRTNAVDIVYEEDFDYSDEQIRTIEAWLGSNGDLIGDDGNVAHGVGGAVSPVATGGVAFILAARANYSSGDLLSVGDDFDGTYDEKMALDYDGLLWTAGGVDAGALLIIPDSALPAFGVQGRLHWDPATPGLKYDDGSVWQDVGATAGSYLEFGTGYTSSQIGASSVEETIGQGVLNGSKILGSLTPYFRTTITPNLTTGSVYVRIYDMGPKAGPPTVPRLVTTLTATTNVLQTLDQVLTVVSAAPVGDEILNTPRMYEATVEVSGNIGDSAFVGIVGFEVQ